MDELLNLGLDCAFVLSPKTVHAQQVVRLLEAGELLTRLRQSALRVETPLARLDVTIFCDMESEVSP